MYGTSVSLQHRSAEGRWIQPKRKSTQYTDPFRYDGSGLAASFGHPPSLIANTFQMYLLPVILKPSKSDLGTDPWPGSLGVQTSLLSHSWDLSLSTNCSQTCCWSRAPGPPLDPEVAPVVQTHNHDFCMWVFFFQFLVSEIRWRCSSVWHLS